MIKQPCELCENKTNLLRYWFGKFLCPNCYEIERSKPQTDTNKQNIQITKFFK